MDVKGVSCHGSAPERGDNAIYKMADILQEVRALNENAAADDKEVKGLVKMLDEKYNPQWEEARFLGRGTVTTSEIFGVSCHGSAPERGDNAIYKMADILQDVRALNENDAADDKEVKGLVKMLDEKYNPQWEEARFLGRGTVTTSEIFYTSPSRCAVADSCSVSLDRRISAGETWESCLD